MIALAISQFHGENVVRLTKIDMTLAQQDEKLAHLKVKSEESNDKLDTLLRRSTTWDKASFWSALKWWIGIIFALIGAIVGYLSYRAKMGHEVTKNPTISQSFDATVDGR
jgi:hypothetical protein